MEKQNICLFLNDRYHFLFSLSTQWNGIFHASVGFVWERACREGDWTHMCRIWNRPITLFHYSEWLGGSVTLPVTARGNTEPWNTKMHLTKASQEDRNAFTLWMSLNKKMLLSSSTSTQYHTFHKLALASCLGLNKALGIVSFFPKGYSG